MVSQLKVRGVPLHFAPEGFQADLNAWITTGVLPDSELLGAILCNELGRAVALTGDTPHSWQLVRETLRWLWNFAPPKSYGSVEKVEAWVRRGGLERKVLQ